MTRLATFGIMLLAIASGFVTASEIARPKFGFVAQAPEDWKMFGERERPGQMLLGFGLPKIWSDIENQDIENSVFIMARRDARSLEEVIADEERRIADIKVSQEPVPARAGKEFIFVTKIDGLEYKNLSAFRYENGVGYVIGFTATHGTFDRNLPKYRAFLEKLRFVTPE